MNVSEVKALLPEAEVFAIHPDASILIAIKRTGMTPETLQKLAEAFERIGITQVCVIAVNDPATDLRIFEV
jgi:hypothetical protein